MTRALVNVPKTARRGEVIEIRAMIQHVMETGYREGPNGVTIPRNIIKRFVCKYSGEEIFSAELFPRSPRIPIWPSAPLRPRAARSRSSGSMRRARRRAPPLKSR